jgi:hypothetical protein
MIRDYLAAGGCFFMHYAGIMPVHFNARGCEEHAMQNRIRLIFQSNTCPNRATFQSSNDFFRCFFSCKVVMVGVCIEHVLVF